MRINSVCINCIFKNQYIQSFRASDEKTRLAFLREVAAQIYSIEETTTSVELSAHCAQLQRAFLGCSQDYESEKRKSNLLMLSHENAVRERIRNSKDPLLFSMMCALAGNYIDFAVVKNVNEEELFELIEKFTASNSENYSIYKRLLDDLHSAKTIAYLVDNCGEIVLDKLFIEEIHRRYSSSVYVVVRGDKVLNDATADDATFVGLDSVANIITTGNAFAGVVLGKVKPETKSIIEKSDVIISKGQGNFETLSGCKLNVYYLFLCKCDLFSTRFNVEKHSAMILHEDEVARYLPQ